MRMFILSMIIYDDVELAKRTHFKYDFHKSQIHKRIFIFSRFLVFIFIIQIDMHFWIFIRRTLKVFSFFGVNLCLPFMCEWVEWETSRTRQFIKNIKFAFEKILVLLMEFSFYLSSSLSKKRSHTQWKSLVIPEEEEEEEKKNFYKKVLKLW
jgi:hypothetical protein